MEAVLTENPASAGTAPGAAIELSGLGKAYGRGEHAFAAVRETTLSVPWGQVIGLLGPNGAGKTTTIKMICGLITPSTGSITLGGYDVARQRSHAVRQIGAVLEGSRNVYWPMSAWENLMYFGRLKGLRGSEVRPRARRLLTDLGLWERRHETVGSYSRGMQQKVAVAAALITDPPIILLDEPTLGLDVEAARTVKDWIAHLAADDGKTVVLTTHQLEVAQELSDRIAVIKEGEIIADLPTTELLARHAENRYEIRVAGSLDGNVGGLPAGARVEPDGSGTRVLLPDADSATVYAVLDQLAAADQQLVSVAQARPSLEAVFIRLLHHAGAAPTPEAGGEGTTP
ncbi:ABC-2 type transport system ATP-binding protein [Haloactinopolyspora alba]|uniref:ABC-2 type transport system ATP-binding protein n=1 Tax=Haloactinopolyspora alba TaxID=648780 RepID=A0A2P8DWR5_9ACTN|nr:ABC transporter ATP-binding protein [Haloactinopolyspora alba]PSL01650.1 ABC-2 type transport system ATP-binding protein [Haloactinopolyspora alba]